MAYNLLKLHQKYKQTIPRISVMMSWGFLCHFKTIWDSKGIVLYLNGIKYRIHCQKAQTLDKSCLYYKALDSQSGYRRHWDLTHRLRPG